MAPQILLVDAELPILNALKRVLRGEGYENLVAQTAQEALTVLSQAEVAVIVCDYGLGSMAGAESPMLPAGSLIQPLYPCSSTSPKQCGKSSQPKP
jgi:DNA-binding NtrC family response regulator